MEIIEGIAIYVIGIAGFIWLIIAAFYKLKGAQEWIEKWKTRSRKKRDVRKNRINRHSEGEKNDIN